MSPQPDMDAAAEKAAKELEKLDPVAVKAVANWVGQHYLTAGYKRLGRILLGKVSNQIVEELKDLV